MGERECVYRHSQAIAIVIVAYYILDWWLDILWHSSLAHGRVVTSKRHMVLGLL